MAKATEPVLELYGGGGLQDSARREVEPDDGRGEEDVVKARRRRDRRGQGWVLQRGISRDTQTWLLLQTLLDQVL